MPFALSPILLLSSNVDVLAGAPAAILDYEVTQKIKTHEKDGDTQSWKETGTS